METKIFSPWLQISAYSLEFQECESVGIWQYKSAMESIYLLYTIPETLICDSLRHDRPMPYFAHRSQYPHEGNQNTFMFKADNSHAELK
jgi:hypothetical protein